MDLFSEVAKVWILFGACGFIGLFAAEGVAVLWSRPRKHERETP